MPSKKKMPVRSLSDEDGDESSDDDDCTLVEPKAKGAPRKSAPTKRPCALDTVTNKRSTVASKMTRGKKARVEEEVDAGELPDDLDPMDFDRDGDYEDYMSGKKSKEESHKQQIKTLNMHAKMLMAQITNLKQQNTGESNSYVLPLLDLYPSSQHPPPPPAVFPAVSSSKTVRS